MPFVFRVPTVPNQREEEILIDLCDFHASFSPSSRPAAHQVFHRDLSINLLFVRNCVDR